MTATAPQIYQTWLDRVAVQLWARDFDALIRELHYPHTMATQDARVTFETPRQMLEGVIHFRDFMARMGATAFHRICSGAAFANEDRTRIEGTHTTYILRGGSYAVDPFHNDMTLVLRGGAWLGAGLRSAVQNSTCTILSPAHLIAQGRSLPGHSQEG